MRILVVEDDKDLAKTIQDILEERHFEVMTCFNYAQAIHEIKRPFDCYLLDHHLPDGSGMELCQYIRQQSLDPIIFISSDTQETSILQGYSLEADDYIEKPFRMKVLLAKIDSVLKRAGKFRNMYTIDDAKLDIQNKSLMIGNDTFLLTVTQMTILECLFKIYPHFVSRKDLCNAIFHSTGHDTSDATLHVRMSELKRKLGSYGKRIESVRYMGYRWHV